MSMLYLVCSLAHCSLCFSSIFLHVAGHLLGFVACHLPGSFLDGTFDFVFGAFNTVAVHERSPETSASLQTGPDCALPGLQRVSAML